eukprot:11167325-Lingulodinium_polyedra.AAC.1
MRPRESTEDNARAHIHAQSPKRAKQQGRKCRADGPPFSVNSARRATAPTQQPTISFQPACGSFAS